MTPRDPDYDPDRPSERELEDLDPPEWDGPPDYGIIDDSDYP
jgi:hypothetical protein